MTSMNWEMSSILQVCFLTTAFAKIDINDTPKDLMWKIVDEYDNITLASEQDVLLDFIEDNWHILQLYLKGHLGHLNHLTNKEILNENNHQLQNINAF